MTRAAAAPVPDPAAASRWTRVVNVLLVVTMLAATGLVVGMVVQNSVLLGRLADEVSTAQMRTTNLHHAQRETLRLLQQLTELDPGEDTETVTVRRGLLNRMVTICAELYPAGTEGNLELRSIRAALDRFPWADLERSGPQQATYRETAMALVSQVETRIKVLYDKQEQLFLQATLDSLAAKQDSQKALILMMSLVVLLAVGSFVLLRRRAQGKLVRAYAALLDEVSERRTLQDQLSHRAFHDELTGLPNRALFLQRLAEMIATADRQTRVASAVLIDLDGFKDVNDTLGHGAGDELLQRTAERLRDCVRSGDLVARLGGDEFAIAVVAGGPDEVDGISRRVLAAVQAPMMVAGQEILINASIGIAHLTDQDGPSDLLSDADIAMYAAKKGGKARFETFAHDMRDSTRQRVLLEQQLARAVELGEIEVFYQPIAGATSGRILAVEALARWQHPEKGLVPPGVFIPVAEESGLIRDIGREVLRQACRTVQEWRESVPGREDLNVTVNVSARQLLAGTFSEHLREALRESGLPAARLTLEITESMLLEESDTVSAELVRLQETGVRLAMDDFGAGYSSIATLLRLPVNVLKIDKSFVDLDHRNRGTLVRAVTELGHSLGMTVVAEGVETEDQLAHLRAANCDAIQGYLISRPLPPAEAREFLTAVSEGLRAYAGSPAE